MIFKPYTKRIANKLSRSIIDNVFKLGIESLILNKKGSAILCYHGIDQIGNKDFNMRFYSKKSIEKHFYYFKKHFNIMSVNDYFQGNFKKDKFNIAITFDDGYRNNYKYLLPLVEKYKIPVSVYVTGLNDTGYPKVLWADFLDIVTFYSQRKKINIGNIEFEKNNNNYISNDHNKISLKTFIKKSGDFEFKMMLFQAFPEFYEIIENNQLDDYWKIVSDDEIIKMSKSEYLTIGSHGYLHNNLGNIEPEEAFNELKKSKYYIENLIQTDVSELAYPDGSYTIETVRFAQELGFKNQLALDYLFVEDYNDNSIRNRHGMYPVYSNYHQIRSIPTSLIV